MDNALDPRDMGVMPTPPAVLSLTTAFRAAVARIFGGKRAEKLREREKHAPALAYVLTGAISLASIFVFAHDDILILINDVLAAQVVAGAQILITIVGVVVADLCVVRSYYRLEILRLRGAMGLFLEHLAYIAFVLTVNMSTFFTVSQTNIHTLLSGAPIIPQQFLSIEGVARTLVVGWTTLQLLITGDKLEVVWSTIMRETRELLGGKAMEWLKSLPIDLSDPAAIFTAYGASIDSMRQPPRWGWLRKRYDASLTHQQIQRKEVIDALQRFGPRKLDEAEAKGYAAARSDMQTMLDELRSAMEAKLAEALANAPRKPLRPITEAKGDGIKKALAEMGIALVTKATKRVDGQEKPSLKTGVALRGGWITSADIVTLSGGKVTPERAKEMAGRLGDSYKSGTSNACPLQPVLRELADLSVLIDPALGAYKASLGEVKEEALDAESEVLATA